MVNCSLRGTAKIVLTNLRDLVISSMSEKWDRKEKLMIVGIAATLASVLVSGSFISKQIEHGNLLAWQEALQSQANEFAKMEVDNRIISCIYQHNDKSIDSECRIILSRPGNRRQAMMYVSEVLDFYHELQVFSHKYNPQFVKGFDQWMDEITRLDITRYYLFINKMDEMDAFRVFGISIRNTDIKAGYLRFKKRVRL